MALTILENVPLSAHTTFKTGGVARFVVVVETVEEVGEAVRFAEQNALPHLILGGGSNLLVSDTGYAGVVIKIAIKGRTYEDLGEGKVRLVVGAGEVLDEVIADTVLEGYWGLENLSAIPGLVGATPVQNVGAYGAEVKHVIEAVEVYSVTDKKIKIFTNDECSFGYRDSIFKTEMGKNFIITAVHFLLTTNAQPNISYRDLALYFSAKEISQKNIREAVGKIRAEKFPDWKVVGTAGSFFKNPLVTKAEGERLQALYPELPMYEAGPDTVKLSLGYILDKVCNLKGFRQGKVGLYDKQALVLVQYGGASTTEVLAFVEIIKAKVAQATKIKIEMEVCLVAD